MTALVIPGVRVEARFDIPPPPPSPSGILGLVGVTDLASTGQLVAVTSPTEIATLFGPATEFSLPELATALRNGVSEVVVSRVSTAAAQRASRTFQDRDGEDVLTIRARAHGPWGNGVSIKIDEVLAADGRSVRYVDVQVFVGKERVEQHRALTVDASQPERDLFAVLNRDSRVVVAVDPLFEADNPAVVGEQPLSDLDAATASKVLTATSIGVLRVAAKEAGARGNLISVTVEEGRPAVILEDAADQGSLRIVAREAGAEDIAMRVSAGTEPGTVTIQVRQGAGTPVSYPDLDTLTAIVRALRADPLVSATAIGGGGMPAVTGATFVELEPTRTVRVRPQGEIEAVSADRLTLTEIVSDFATNLFVEVRAIEGASPLSLPDARSEDELDLNTGFLVGGRAAGPALRLRGQANSAQDVVEIVPKPDQDASTWTLTVAQTGERVRLTLRDTQSARVLEDHADLTMDPDDPRFLPRVLEQESERLSAFDLLVRSGTTALPRATPGPVPLVGGQGPSTGDYLAAITALEADERIDLVMAAVDSQDDDNLDVRRVHQALLAYAIAATDRGAPAIALGAVSSDEEKDVGDVLDHANDVRHQRFVLCTPAGSAAAVAGLLGRLPVHFSPTFKTPGFLPVAAGRYRESELKRLVDPERGNVLVVQKHRARGTIVVKGIATNGWQINVTRTADMAVREVKKIAEGYIGALNDEASRNALQQELIQYFLRLEREGAIVPSTDGQDPAFVVRVYASQQDFAQGIVRIDLAMRPVRAIDYVYATLRVRN